jgi:hypothetical protein
MPVTREWRCSCGAWLPWSYGRHPHIKTRNQSLSDMIAARERQDIDQIYEPREITYEWRTPEHAVKEISFG